MELELGLKITHTRDDLTSISELRISKDSSCPVFFTRETDTVFILIIHLKGFRRENIEVKINQEGNMISISGKRAVQEMVLIGWIMQRKEAELRTFSKVFRIPNGVVLDKVKAKFNEQDSSLTITMPKSLKGISGFEIEEVKIQDQEPKIEPESTQVSDDHETKVPEKGKNVEENDRGSNAERDEEIKKSEEIPEAEATNEEKPEKVTENARKYQEQETSEDKSEKLPDEETFDDAIQNEINEDEEEKDRDSSELDKEKHVCEDDSVAERKPIKRRSKLCGPIVVAGSAFLVSFIVIVMRLIKSKKR